MRNFLTSVIFVISQKIIYSVLYMYELNAVCVCVCVCDMTVVITIVTSIMLLWLQSNKLLIMSCVTFSYTNNTVDSAKKIGPVVLQI